MAMWLRWFPWRQLVSRLARAQGIVDPVSLLSRLESFAQPLEVKEPIELLRSGLVFHARGLLNAGAIQHNLDWVWPYWVERQYDPGDVSFLPRAFSLTHVNLTNRNWTALGVPDWDGFPLVDPRGLLTPFWDGWSLDAWLVGDDGERIVPSRLDRVEQRLELEGGCAVVTESGTDSMSLVARADVTRVGGVPTCSLLVRARSDRPASLAISLRPYNAEGVSFVHTIALDGDARAWTVDGRHRVTFDHAPERWAFSDYAHGDVFAALPEAGSNGTRGVSCRVGLATAVAMFALENGTAREIRVEVPLQMEAEARKLSVGVPSATPSWEDALAGHCRLAAPDPKIVHLYDAALRTVVLHSPGEVYPGPYTYKRFWFRDAAFILHALLCAGLTDRVERVLDRFPSRQTRAGFFRSQQNEWDSNGEALWILWRFCELTGRAPKPEWVDSIRRGGRWIVAQRLPGHPASPHAGLLPPGFSAEHLGPNDYYYWDDFWSVGGLRAAAALLERAGDGAAAAHHRREADALLAAIDTSLATAGERLGRLAMPASPYRRLDSGAIGSIAGGYPLQIQRPRDERLVDTARYLIDECFVDGCFFQDMIHSGLNAYLTLEIAQVLLRAGDERCVSLMHEVARHASPTGQWPEAIHPRTGGGCMGDGHHVWAAAEWILYLRNAFVREEEGVLVLASGIPPAWLDAGGPIELGPAPTPFGAITVRLEREGDDGLRVAWDAEWRAIEPPIEVRLLGRRHVLARAGEKSVVVPPR